MSEREYRRSFGAPSPELRPDFYMDSVKDEVASHGAGRDIFREVERVRIIIPGAVASIVVKNVDDSHRRRWPQAYEAFRAGREAPVSGLPLEEWPILNRAQIAELRAMQIRTVEEMAALSDLAVQRIGMGGLMLRDRARAYLDDSQREALTTKLSAENDVLRSRVGALERQVDELGRQLLALAAAQPAGAGHSFQTYVPGEHDPLQPRPPGVRQGLPSAKAGAGAAPAEPPSSLDSFADRPARPPREPVNFDPTGENAR